MIAPVHRAFRDLDSDQDSVIEGHQVESLLEVLLCHRDQETAAQIREQIIFALEFSSYDKVSFSEIVELLLAIEISAQESVFNPDLNCYLPTPVKAPAINFMQ